MHIVDLSIKRPIMVGMGLIALCIFGAIAYFTMPLSLIPDGKTPYVTVQTIYGGASPEVIENQITKKIEDQVSALAELDTVISYSMDSVSVVMVQFKQKKDENLALQEVKDKVEAISGEFPPNADKPVITKMSIAGMTPIMSVVVQGDMTSAELYTFAKENVSQKLSQISGVGSVKVSGGAEREIQVNVKNATVYERSVPVAQIAGIIAQANLDMPGGNLTYKNRDIPVQLTGMFTDIDDLKNLDIPTAGGIYKIHQLADVSDTAKTVRERTMLLDKKASRRDDNVILLQIMKNPSGNSVDIITQAEKILPQIEKSSGGKVKFEVLSEEKTFVKDTVADALSNVYLGIILTCAVLLLFLHEWRSTLIVALAMPFSVISTFFVMKAIGYTLNLVTLIGISTSTGSLVANSVVVIENIAKYLNQGLPREEATAKGTKEVLVAIFASTLTNVAVFLPLGTLDNIMGPILAQFAFTTVFATVFSIIVSFTLTPLMASKILSNEKKEAGVFARAFDAGLGKLKNGYRRTLSVVIRNKRTAALTILASIVIFVLSLCLAPNIGYEIMPTTDGGKMNINIELAQGADLAETARIFRIVEDRLGERDEVEKIETELGSLGSTDIDVSIGKMTVFLVPKSERKLSSQDYVPIYTQALSDIADAKISVSAVTEITLGGMQFNVDLYLKGDDMAELMEAGSRVQKELNKIPGLANVTLSSKAGKKQLNFIPDRKAISNDGLTVQDIAVAMRSGIDGLVLTKYKENNVEYDLRVKLADVSLSDIEDIRNIPVVTRFGVFPLEKYARVEFADGTNKIPRTDKKRTIEITGDILTGYAIGTVQNQAVAVVNGMDLPDGISLEPAGTSKLMNDTIQSLAVAFAVAILIIYMLLAATLENLIQPLFILSTVPLSLIGVIISTVATNIILNIIAMLGIIMLVGIVVNNAILILDEYNALKRGGTAQTEAMLSACTEKLRAILMSNLAIILGMLPMALGIGESGAEMRIPMGIIVIGGIISSTVLTLYVLPALETLCTRGKRGKFNHGEKWV